MIHRSELRLVKFLITIECSISTLNAEIKMISKVNINREEPNKEQLTNFLSAYFCTSGAFRTENTVLQKVIHLLYYI